MRRAMAHWRAVATKTNKQTNKWEQIVTEYLHY
jgi:hypothetical protein